MKMKTILAKLFAFPTLKTFPDDCFQVDQGLQSFSIAVSLGLL